MILWETDKELGLKYLYILIGLDKEDIFVILKWTQNIPFFQ